MGKVIDLTGQVFGRLTVIEYVGSDKHRNSLWRCVCACGAERVVTRHALVQGLTKSCGCWNRDRIREQGKRNVKHGHNRRGHRTSEYGIWASMKRRCTDPKHPAYPRYGGRGIKVCDRWMNSFEAFLEDMGLRPGPGYTIERIDNDKGYEPGNCRWATVAEQQKNRSDNRWIEYEGEKLTLTDWARKLGVRSSTLYRWLKKGFTMQDVVEKVRLRSG